MSEAVVFLFFQCLALGGIVGVLAGLLGIGGGLIVVPALHLLLPDAGIEPQLVMPMALATSLASIVMTSAASARNHYKRGNVSFSVVRSLVPGVLIGGLCGSTLADLLPTAWLPRIFGGIVLILALQMLVSLRVQSHRPLPSPLGQAAAGGFIGMIASLAGIGGGALTVPYLSYHGVPMRQAIGCSSLSGAVLSVSAMTGFIILGLHSEQVLPKWSIGYVYLPALTGIILTSVVATKLGVHLAIKLPTHWVKKIFALFLMIVSIEMLF
ncbi:sulfite exporter TauE/SafE family protein [Parasalinivibrio latis]|uniref:sulfite exporter TauE/SafE family protein n=1 Tax=Parasalinivibrio latis TaxID=2952610 RepID=UPI0030E07635